MAKSMSVEEWVSTIKIATDEKSPFQGMVDLTDIFNEPTDKQWKIFDKLSDDTKAKLQELYGEKA
jgi:hypothetical protein